MSFLKNIFGPKKTNPTSLVLHDQFLEVAQFEVESAGPKLSGLNRINLDGGIIQRGEIVRESEFQAALQNLFPGAAPNPIRPNHLFVNIPFEQLYSFIRLYPTHTSEDHMKIGVLEMVRNQAPFEFQDVEVDYFRQISKRSIYCGALVYPKQWRHLVAEACTEIGFSDLHFVAEPVAQTSFLKPEFAEHFALISWQEGAIVLSLFVGGLLYDSYVLREKFETGSDGQFIFSAVETGEQNLKNMFKVELSHLVFSSFPQNVREVIQSLAEKTGKQILYLRQEDSVVTSFINVEQYSTTLVGLANYSLNPEAEKHKM